MTSKIQDTRSASKAAYVRPQLAVYGSVRNLTGGSGGGGNDGGGVMVMA